MQNENQVQEQTVKENINYPLTFEKTTTIEIITTEGRKAYVSSTRHQTNRYETHLFYKPICTLL